MAPRSRSRATYEVSEARPSVSLSDLPDDVLVRLLGVASWKERQRAALVSKRFAAAACSPELLQQVDAGEVKGIAALQSLTAWLARHCGHVRQLQLSATPLSKQDSAEVSAVEAALTCCLETAAAAGQLVQLAAGSMITSTAWLAGLPSLRKLELVASQWHSPLRLSPAISALTGLGSLWLKGRTLMERGLRLPPSITQLSLDANSLCIPAQVIQLTGLAELRLVSDNTAAGLSSLSCLAGSLTQLQVSLCNLPSSLSTLTRLQHLYLWECDDEYGATAAAVNSALSRLTQLTCLVLFAQDYDPAPGLACLPQLQRCHLNSLLNPQLPGGAWLRNLRWLASSIETLLSSGAALQAATALECVEVIMELRVKLYAPPAIAFFDWLAQHPPLHRVAFDAWGWDDAGRPWQLDNCISLLRSRRPGLQIDCYSFEGSEDQLYKLAAMKFAPLVTPVNL